MILLLWLTGYALRALNRHLRWEAERQRRANARLARRVLARTPSVMRVLPRETFIMHLFTDQGRIIHLCEACALQWSDALHANWRMVPCECDAEPHYCQARAHAERLLALGNYGDVLTDAAAPWETSPVDNDG